MTFEARTLVRPVHAAFLVSAAVWTVVWLAFPAAGSWRTGGLDVLSIAVAGYAGLLCVVTAALDENARLHRSLLFIGAGALSWAAGQVVWSYYEILANRPAPYPSLADLGYLLCVPLIGLGLVFWPSTGRRRPARRVVEATLAAGAASVAAFAFLIAPAISGSSSGWTKALDVLYPISEFGVLAIVVGALLLGEWTERHRLFLVLGGLASLATADGLYNAAYKTGGPIDIGWMLAFLLIGLASAPPSVTERLQNLSFPRWSWAAMIVLLLVAVGYERTVDDVRRLGWPDAVETIGLIVIFVVLVVRSAVLHRRIENQMEIAAETAAGVAEHQAREAASRDRLLAEIVAAREDEARRVAGLLHDDAVQQLTALALRLELAERRLDLPEIGELAGDARDITRALRRLMTELYPAVLESQGIAAAIELSAEGLREHGVHVRISPCETRVPRAIEAVAYRVIHEALTNIDKHAGASEVTVEIIAGDVLRCEVRDDGRGFDTVEAASALVRGSIGLRLARERVESTGGRLDMCSAPGEGTLVSFELPVALALEVAA